MNHGSGWDVLQRQVVAWLDVGVCALLDAVTLLQLVWADDVTLLAIGVVQECNARGAVRVVLDVSYNCRNAILVVTTEVDNTVLTLVSSTDVASGYTALVVATARLGEWAK